MAIIQQNGPTVVAQWWWHLEGLGTSFVAFEPSQQVELDSLSIYIHKHNISSRSSRTKFSLMALRDEETRRRVDGTDIRDAPNSSSGRVPGGVGTQMFSRGIQTSPAPSFAIQRIQSSSNWLLSGLTCYRFKRISLVYLRISARERETSANDPRGAPSVSHDEGDASYVVAWENKSLAPCPSSSLLISGDTLYAAIGQLETAETWWWRENASQKWSARFSFCAIVSEVILKGQ